MIADALVVLAATASDMAQATAELRERGATTVRRQRLDGRRTLLYASFGDDRAAASAVTVLRTAGWPAVAHPVERGHLAAWEAHTRPVVIRDRLWVCFPWADFDRSVTSEVTVRVVEIDPGRSFGTGSHPSTRLLLGELVDRLHGGERVLDLGSGSGVLGVSAAALGARSVLAVDLEGDARAATRANAVRNDVGHVVDVATDARARGRFDVVLANIGAAVLVNLAPVLTAAVSPGGWLGVSGISPAQVSVVCAAMPLLRPVALPRDEDWAAIVFEGPP